MGKRGESGGDRKAEEHALLKVPARGDRAGDVGRGGQRAAEVRVVCAQLERHPVSAKRELMN